MKQGTLNRPTSLLVHLYTVPFFGCEKHTDTSAFGLMISLAGVCYGYSRVAKYGFGAILAVFNFLNQLPHQNEPEFSVGIFSPT